jgi:hypothetical protein
VADDPIARAVSRLGVDAPPLTGPLDTFRLQAGSGTVGFYLAGDLHAMHPEASDYPSRHPRDPSLDKAIVSFEYDDGLLEAVARDGVWFLPLDPERQAMGSRFVLRDSEARVRTWLLLPPPEAMLGRGRSWLSAVRPPPGSSTTTARPLSS